MNHAELRAKVYDYFNTKLNEGKDRRNAIGPFTYDEKREATRTIELHDLPNTEFWEIVGKENATREFTDFCDASGVPIQQSSQDLWMILDEIRKAKLGTYRSILDHDKSYETYDFTAPEQATQPAHEAKPPTAPLGQSIDDFIFEHSRQWAAKTTKQNRAYLNILLEFFGPDRLLGTTTKQDASEVKKVLQALPSSRNTKPALKELPLMQAIKVTGQKTISPKTINSQLQMFQSFFD